jgi:uncharacterized RDD family membrane protein YckC
VIGKQLFFGVTIAGAWLPGVGAVTGIDYLWPLWDRENRAVHDFAARTRVVRRLR